MPVMMTSSPGERTAVFFAAFLATTLTSFLGLGRAIWCDVNRHGVGSPVASRLPAARAVAGLKTKRDNKIGIGERVTSPPLPHHRTCGSASGGSVRLS